MPCQLVVERVTLCWVGFLLIVENFTCGGGKLLNTPVDKGESVAVRESRKGSTSGELLYVFVCFAIGCNWFLIWSPLFVSLNYSNTLFITARATLFNADSDSRHNVNNY